MRKWKTIIELIQKDFIVEENLLVTTPTFSYKDISPFTTAHLSISVYYNVC